MLDMQLQYTAQYEMGSIPAEQCMEHILYYWASIHCTDTTSAYEHTHVGVLALQMATQCASVR